MARISPRRHRPDAGEQARLARLLRYRSPQVGRALQRRRRLRDPRAHDAVRGHVATEIRSGADLEPPGTLRLCGLQRRPRCMQPMAPPRTASPQANRFKLPGQILRCPEWYADRHPELRPLLEPLTCAATATGPAGG